MKLTWNWLLDHLETDKDINQILETLPKLGLEVATVLNPVSYTHLTLPTT